MERIPIELESFHHVYNRGTDKRIVFGDSEDYERFILYLNILNDVEIKSPTDVGIITGRKIYSPSAERLVNLVAFCLMPNHFHLLLQEHVTGGISKFMHRLSTAYTMYFNDKQDRSGALFQGRFKSKFVDTELYLLKIIDYIHVNPKNLPGSLKYEWSSYHYYCGDNKFGHLLQFDTLQEITKIVRGAEYRNWLSTQSDFSDIFQLSIDGEDIKS